MLQRQLHLLRLVAGAFRTCTNRIHLIALAATVRLLGSTRLRSLQLSREDRMTFAASPRSHRARSPRRNNRDPAPTGACRHCLVAGAFGLSRSEQTLAAARPESFAALMQQARRPPSPSGHTSGATRRLLSETRWQRPRHLAPSHHAGFIMLASAQISPRSRIIDPSPRDATVGRGMRLAGSAAAPMAGLRLLGLGAAPALRNDHGPDPKGDWMRWSRAPHHDTEESSRDRMGDESLVSLR